MHVWTGLILLQSYTEFRKLRDQLRHRQLLKVVPLHVRGLYLHGLCGAHVCVSLILQMDLSLYRSVHGHSFLF
jgi:hypothetical protein